MGDIVSFVERAQENFDAEQAKRLQKKMGKGKFDFNDFLEQIGQIKKMGNMKEIMGMIPGVGKAIKDIDIDDNAFKSIEAMIHSMTPQERANPELLDKNWMLAITKCDLISEKEAMALESKLAKNFHVLCISAVTNWRLTELKDHLWELINPEKES